MIMKTLLPHKIGEICVSATLNDSKGISHTVSYQVLEEVSLKDYLNYCREIDGRVGIILKDDKFYRISID